MRKLFISYARENKRDIAELVDHLGLMGYETWVDSKLRGGQDWWEEILRRIANSDVFIAVISKAALNSTACRREFDWAESLRRPVLPVAVEPPPAALPRRFARRQIIDYSEPEKRDRAALMLQGGLGTVPSAPPLPDPLPEPPAAPLSYLTDLVELVAHPNPMDHAQQHQILQQLGAALRSVDPEECRGGQDILERFASRTDIYADVDRVIAGFRQLAQPSPLVTPEAAAAGLAEEAQTEPPSIATTATRRATPAPPTVRVAPNRPPSDVSVPTSRPSKTHMENAPRSGASTPNLKKNVPSETPPEQRAASHAMSLGGATAIFAGVVFVFFTVVECLFFGLLPPYLEAALAVGGLSLILIPMRRHGATQAVALLDLLCGGAILALAVLAIFISSPDGRSRFTSFLVSTVTGLVLVVAGAITWRSARRTASHTSVV